MKELDLVRLKENDEEAGVKTTFIGTVVDVVAPGVFTVEFIDDEGDTIIPALMKIYDESQLIQEN